MTKRRCSKNNNKFMNLPAITPLTETQEDVFDSFNEGYHLVLHGYAGTGKTFLSMYLSIQELMKKKYDKIIIIRSVVPSRDMGFLPGNQKEKGRVYEEPYKSIVNEIFQRGDAYDVLKASNQIDFVTTSFLRGVTYNRCLIIVDEIQNMSWQELSTIVTRMGIDTKVVFSGDFRQSDLREREKTGLQNFLQVMKKMKEVDFIEFEKEDIIRSGLCKSFIIESDKLNLN